MNGSVLPSELSLRTNSILSPYHFTRDDFIRIINKLEINKAHDHDKINIRMLKMCYVVMNFEDLLT